MGSGEGPTGLCWGSLAAPAASQGLAVALDRLYLLLLVLSCQDQPVQCGCIPSSLSMALLLRAVMERERCNH